MKRIVCMLLIGLVTVNVGIGVVFAQETSFNVKLANANGSQPDDGKLIFSDTDKRMSVRVADREVATIPYDEVDKISYEYTKKHRITQGAIVMIASVGAGAIVMLTKSKSHWLYLDYHDQGSPKTVVLRLDKKDYKAIIDAARTHTGKDVQMVGDSKNKQPKKS
jgi:hypothetical protein